MGALIPEALAAAGSSPQAGVQADVVCITSADLLVRALQARAGVGEGDPAILEELFPRPAAAGHGARRAPAHADLPRRGARGPGQLPRRQRFGQSGDLAELYEHHQIDAESVVGAALDLLDA